MHRLTEALKFAFAGRTEISDVEEGFADEARRKRIEGFWQTKEYGRDVARNITDVSELLLRSCEESTEMPTLD
jgi:hypothetical protein